MASTLAALCDCIADLLTRSRLAELAALHLFPCPYEAHGRIELLDSPVALERLVGHRLAAQQARGLRTVEARVVAQEIPRGPRLRAWVCWTYLMADGTVEDGGTDLLFLLRLPDGRLVVEMIDFLSLPPGPDAMASAVESAA